MSGIQKTSIRCQNGRRPYGTRSGRHVGSYRLFRKSHFRQLADRQVDNKSNAGLIRSPKVRKRPNTGGGFRGNGFSRRKRSRRDNKLNISKSNESLVDNGTSISCSESEKPCSSTAGVKVII